MNKYIYLISSPHSGSTLIAFLLGNHPQIATVGELAGRTDYDGYRCSCGCLITECSFWKNVSDRLRYKGMSLNLKNFDIFIDDRKCFNSMDAFYNYYLPSRWMDNLRDLFFSFSKSRKEWINNTLHRGILLAEAITDCCGKENFFDTTKDIYRLKYLLAKLGSRVKVLYMIRDGRGVMNSLITKEKLPDRRAIQSWLWANRMMERIIKNYCSKDQCFLLKYEDLCENPESRLRELLRFIGVSQEVNLSNFKHDQFHIIGNFMRKTFNGAVSLDEKWRKELKDNQLALFEKLAGKKNRQLGYR